MPLIQRSQSLAMHVEIIGRPGPVGIGVLELDVLEVGAPVPVQVRVWAACLRRSLPVPLYVACNLGKIYPGFLEAAQEGGDLSISKRARNDTFPKVVVDVSGHMLGVG